MNMDSLDQATLAPNLPPIEPPKKRGWWSRNWLWFVPTLLLGCVILCCGCPGGIVLYVLNQAFRLPAYQTAMEKIKADETIRQEIGEPIEMRYLPPPSLQLTQENGRGDADIRWTIAGPKGEARAHLTARIADEKWDIVILEIVLANGKKVALSGEGGEAAPFQPGQPKSDGQKPDENAPPPEINLPAPPGDMPGEK